MAKAEPVANLRKISTKHSPVYLLTSVLSLALFGICAFIVSTESLSVAEQQAFEYVNGLNQAVGPILSFFDSIGSIIVVILLSSLLLIFRRWRLSIEVFLAGFFALTVSSLLIILFERGRPLEILGQANIRTVDLVGFGFPSASTAIVFAVVTTTAPFVAKKLSGILWLMAVLVAISQLYVGSNLPVDVVAGSALGIFIGSLIRILFGSPDYGRSTKHVIAALESANVNVAEVKQLDVDARGSAPYFITTKEGKKLFAKIITGENRIADFMFKLWRSVVYSDFEDETPFLSAKQAIEHEAYITMLAKSKGVNVPIIRYVISLNRDFAILAMDQLDGQSLDTLPKKQVTDKLVKDIWKQVKIMHDAQIAHRDLRLANVFVQNNGEPILIDFSFGESFASTSRMKMDRVEMLVSFSLLVGPKKAVELACSVVGKHAIAEVAPYLQLDALAGSTTAAVKSQPNLLASISKAIEQTSGMELADLHDLRRLKLTIGWVVLIVAVLIVWALVINN